MYLDIRNNLYRKLYFKMIYQNNCLFEFIKLITFTI
jgi:hypothetical protein